VIFHISFLYVYICTSSLSDLPVSQIQYRFRACKSRHVLVVPTWEKRGSPHFSNNPLTYWNGASKFYKPLALSILDNVVLLLFTFWAAHPLQPAPSKSNCEMLCRRHLKFEPTLLNVFFSTDSWDVCFCYISNLCFLGFFPASRYQFNKVVGKPLPEMAILPLGWNGESGP